MDEDDLDLKDGDLGDDLDDGEIDDFSDITIPGKISGKGKSKKRDDDDEEDDSLDALADAEGGVLPEDSFDDVDLW